MPPGPRPRGGTAQPPPATTPGGTPAGTTSGPAPGPARPSHAAGTRAAAPTQRDAQRQRPPAERPTESNATPTDNDKQRSTHPQQQRKKHRRMDGQMERRRQDDDPATQRSRYDLRLSMARSSKNNTAKNNHLPRIRPQGCLWVGATLVVGRGSHREPEPTGALASRVVRDPGPPGRTLGRHQILKQRLRARALLEPSPREGVK